MKRDIFYYYPSPIEAVYEAHTAAIKDVFGKSGDGKAPHTVSFELNFSLKYNMNGGVCRIHLKSYREGTAVRLCYTVAQAVGAKCEAHAGELAKAVGTALNSVAERLSMTAEVFESCDKADEEPIKDPLDLPPVTEPAPVYKAPEVYNMPLYGAPPIYTAPTGRAQPVYGNSPFSPAAQASTQPQARFCSRCGKPFKTDDKFCSGCGARRM